MGAEFEDLISGTASTSGTRRLVSKKGGRKDGDWAQRLNLGAGSWASSEDVVTRLSQPEEADITSSTSIEDLSVADLEALAADLDVQMRRCRGSRLRTSAMLRDRLWAISQALGTDS